MSVGLFLKTKENLIWQKFAISTVFLGALFVFSLPTLIYKEITVLPVTEEKHSLSYDEVLQKNRKAVELSILPMMKATYYKFLALNLQNYIFTY